MSTYTLNFKPTTEGPLDRIAERLEHPEHFLEELLTEDLQPILGGNYDRSGLRAVSGVLKNAVTKRGAVGNISQVTASGIRAGVDYGALPYARYAIEGRGAVQAKGKKALSFMLDGKRVTVRRVKAAPAHAIFYLTAEDKARLDRRFGELVARGSK